MMEFNEIIKNLSDKEKCDLAAKLTVAAMFLLSEYDGESFSAQEIASNKTFELYEKMFNRVNSGQNPSQNPYIGQDKE